MLINFRIAKTIQKDLTSIKKKKKVINIIVTILENKAEIYIKMRLWHFQVSRFLLSILLHLQPMSMLSRSSHP